MPIVALCQRFCVIHDGVILFQRLKLFPFPESDAAADRDRETEEKESENKEKQLKCL